MPDLNVDLDYFDHPKTLMLVAILGHGADVLPLRLWAYCGKYKAKDGVLGRLRPVEIEALIRWWGGPGLGVRGLMRAGFLSKSQDGYAAHDFRKHQGHIHALKVRNKKAAVSRWKKIKNVANLQNPRREIKSTTGMPVVQDGMPQPTNQPTNLKTEKGDADFEAFWSLYPKKVGKGDARAAWKKARPSVALYAQIMRAVADQKAGKAWTKDGGQYIPNPATWLNGGRWDDVAEPVSSAPAGSKCERRGCGLTGNWVKGISVDGKTKLCIVCLEEEAVRLEQPGAQR